MRWKRIKERRVVFPCIKVKWWRERKTCFSCAICLPLMTFVVIPRRRTSWDAISSCHLRQKKKSEFPSLHLLSLSAQPDHGMSARLFVWWTVQIRSVWLWSCNCEHICKRFNNFRSKSTIFIRSRNHGVMQSCSQTRQLRQLITEWKWMIQQAFLG